MHSSHYSFLRTIIRRAGLGILVLTLLLSSSVLAAGGKLQLADGSSYQGEIKDGLASGKGVQTYSDRRRYEGEFVNGQREGQGTFSWPSGEKHSGWFKQGEGSGYGVHSWKNGDKLTGEFTAGLLQGEGVYQWAEGKKYEGQFKDSQFHGIGKITEANGSYRYVIFRNNTFWGEYKPVEAAQIKQGKEKWLDNTIIFIDKYAYSTNVRMAPDYFSTGLKGEELYGKRFVIKELVAVTQTYGSAEYYWRLQGEDGKMLWLADREYSSSYSSYSSDTRPFIFQEEVANPSDYKEVAAGEILAYKNNWLGQKLKFNTDRPRGFKKIIRDSAEVSPDKLLNRPLKIIALYRETGSSYRSNYYWKIIDEETGDLYWYRDEHYQDSASYGRVSVLDDKRPFVVEAEQQAAQKRTDEFTAWAGRTVWADLNRSSELGRLDIGHLERLVIKEVRLDSSFKEVVFDFERENGSVVSWKHSVSKYLKGDETPEGMLGRVAVLDSPFDKYEWPEETWNLIKQQRVRIGWGKDKCIMSWGRPERVNRTTTAWGVHEQWVYSMTSYLYFEDGVLHTIQN